jgi:hypothetical protein
VQYFDKARMELNPAVTGVDALWRVTTGLLVSEMVQGRIQTGDTQFMLRPATDSAVAGNATGTSYVRYADFSGLIKREESDKTGREVSATLSRGGVVTTGAQGGVTYARYASETGHNIADVFWKYMNQTGLVLDESGRLSERALFDWVYLMGYPITEPYWVGAQIGGTHHTVLVQLFQRRTLTYVPAFAEGWRVQMGNVGQHYYDWRYKWTNTVPGGPHSQPVATPTRAATFPATGGFVGISGDSFVYAGQEVKLKGTNYWISTQPFVSTWAEWDGPQALAELQRAREMGVNTIRIGIPFNHFATRDIMWDDDESMARVSEWILNQLTQLLQVASVHGMKVIFVLFEWYDDYPPEGSRQERTNIAYLEGIVGRFANDDRVLGWDLHNEPDHYGEWQGGKQEKVIKWLQRVSGYVRHLDKKHPIMVGVGNYRNLWHPASDGTTILSFTDVAAFHSYDAGGLQGQIEELKRHTSMPILLQEMGWPTSHGDEAPPPNADYSEATQTFLYRTMLQTSTQNDIAGVVQWTLYDFIPKSTTGNRYASFEEYFGLLRLDGSPKPAAAIFRENYPARALPSDTKTFEPLTPAGKRNRKP